MTKPQIVTRSGWDRIRYAVIFEALLIIGFGAALAGLSGGNLLKTGALAVVLSVIAMIVSVFYNYLFDQVDVRFGRIPTERALPGRVIHAAGFEFLLVLTSLPIIMWWMSWSFWRALTFDLVAMACVIVYTFLFTLAYDRVFPIAQQD